MKTLHNILFSSLLLFAAGSCSSTPAVTHATNPLDLQILLPETTALGQDWIFRYESMQDGALIQSLSCTVFDDQNADNVMQKSESLYNYSAVHHPPSSWAEVGMPVDALFDTLSPKLFVDWACTDGSAGSTVIELPASVKSWSYGQDKRKGHSSNP